MQCKCHTPSDSADIRCAAIIVITQNFTLITQEFFINRKFFVKNMPGPDLPEIPVPLKSLQHYLKIASEHDQRDPVVSYWARLYALQTGLKMSTKTTAENNFLLKLMDWLETTKKALSDNEAITNDVAAQAHLENWALKLFLYADKNDRESNFNKSVVQSFYTAGLLYDVLTTFGELTEEAAQNRKYAKWKASYIHNCLKNGETPVPGPMKEEDEEDDISNVNFGPEEDLLADVAADSEQAEANDGEDENQADAATTNELDTGLDQSAEKAPSEPEVDSAEEAPSEPEVDQAEEVRSEPEVDAAEEAPDEEDENQADAATPNEPETSVPESGEEAPSMPGTDGAEEAADAEYEKEADEATSNEPDDPSPESAEEAPSEPGIDGAEEAPSEPEADPVSAEGDDEAPGMQQPTPPPNTDSFGFPSVPGGSSTGIGGNNSQAPGNTPYPTLPSSITPNPYNPAPTPTSPSVPQDFTATPKPTGGVTLNTEQMNKAQKYIKWAGSAINYDDVPTAIENLQKALHLLTTGIDS